MRILQVNKFNFSAGGADKYFMTLTAQLQAAGQETAVFSMAHPQNNASPWSRYFVSDINFHSPSWSERLKIPGRMIYSREAARQFGRLLDDFKPEIIHCHNIYHQLSPSILPEAKKRGRPVVMHLHDYKLACPNYRLFSQDKFCDACLRQKSYYPCVQRNCYESFSRSFLAYLEMTIHHDWLHIYEKNIDLLIAPSNFIKEIMVRAGWPTEKIAVVYNPAPEVTAALPEKDYFLYFGRLSPEKGIADLINAVKLNGAKLQIVGDGPQAPALKKIAAPEIASGQIKFFGHLEGQKLAEAVAGARAIVIPSRWPENMPLSLLESLACSKIIIASRVGGLPEIIREGKNGFLFTPGLIEELAQKIKAVSSLPPENLKLIKIQAQETARKLNPRDHLDAIMKIYLKLAKKSA